MLSPILQRAHSVIRERSILHELNDDDLGSLLELGHAVRLARDEILCHKGDPGDRLFIVIRGRLKALANAADGKEIVFGVMSPGDLIGEISVPEGGTRSATVQAMDPAELLSIPRRRILPLLDERPSIARVLGQSSNARLRRLSEQVEDSAFLSLQARLAKQLLLLARMTGNTTGREIELAVRQQDLADLLAVTRESVNKHLRGWEEAGWIALGRGRVVLRDLEALEREAQA